MTENTAAATPVRAISQTAARLSFAAAATFLVLLAALHFIKPELDPSWRMISEYEIGRYGWMMVLAFLSLALSCVALFVAIRSQIRTTGGYIGLVLLLVSALGMTIAAIFTTDPITASQDKLTTHGNLHGVGALLGIPTFPIAVTLVSLSLARNPAWSSARLGCSRWPESLRPDVLADPLPAAALHGLQDLVGAVEGLSARVPYLLNQLLRSIVALGVGGHFLLTSREVYALQILLKLTQVEVT